MWLVLSDGVTDGHAVEVSDMEGERLSETDGVEEREGKDETLEVAEEDEHALSDGTGGGGMNVAVVELLIEADTDFVSSALLESVLVTAAVLDTEGVFVEEPVAEAVPVEDEEEDPVREGDAEAVEEEDVVPVADVVEEVVAEEECDGEKVLTPTVPDILGLEEEEAVAEEEPVEEEDWLGEAVTLLVAVEEGEAEAELEAALTPFSVKEQDEPPSHGVRHWTLK